MKNSKEIKIENRKKKIFHITQPLKKNIKLM